MFEKCCNYRTPIQYSIVHEPIPLPLPKKKDAIVKQLLWYAPNIDSFQAKNNDLIREKLYNDFSFTYIMDKMGMDEDRDVKWLSSNDCFDEDDWSFFERDICCNCQKIIISRCSSLTKTNDLLRALRNCLAHGHFVFVNDYLIGFSQQTRKSAPPVKKAVIKIKPELLLSALSTLSSYDGKEQLIKYAFIRMGYSIASQAGAVFLDEIHGKMIKLYPDFIIQKRGKKYGIEYASWSETPFLHIDDLHIHYTLRAAEVADFTWVLFIDTSRTTKAVREMEQKNKNIRIIDINEIKKLLGDPPVDVLSEGVNA